MILTFEFEMILITQKSDEVKSFAGNAWYKYVFRETVRRKSSRLAMSCISDRWGGSDLFLSLQRGFCRAPGFLARRIDHLTNEAETSKTK